jgi:putative effector of murein hydrolase
MLDVMLNIASLECLFMWQLVRRHAPELGAVIPLTGLFSIFITIFLGRQLGLADSLTSSFVGRSLSPPFAVPITRILGGLILTPLDTYDFSFLQTKRI